MSGLKNKKPADCQSRAFVRLRWLVGTGTVRLRGPSNRNSPRKMNCTADWLADARSVVCPRGEARDRTVNS